MTAAAARQKRREDEKGPGAVPGPFVSWFVASPRVFGTRVASAAAEVAPLPMTRTEAGAEPDLTRHWITSFPLLKDQGR
jgi:hypothetical protein